MNEKQLDLILKELIRSDKQKKAIKLCILENKSAYEAEKLTYGKITSTVARDVNRVYKLLDTYEAICKAGFM